MFFERIPNSIRVPGQYIEVSNTRAVRGLPGMPRRILVLGQRLAAGAVAAEILTKITHSDQAAAAFGRGSMAHQICEKLRGANDWQEVQVLALDDKAAGAFAAGSFKPTGVSIKSGTGHLYIGGRYISVGVSEGDSLANITTAATAAINADRMVPATAAVNGGDSTQVDLTAKHKGEAGNDIDIRFNYDSDQFFPKNMGADITKMTGGTGNPDITDALAAIGEDWFTDIVMPYTDAANLALLEAELDNRFGPLIQRDAMAFAFKSGTHSALSTFGSARNSPHISVLGLKGCPNPPWEVAAVYAGVAAYNLAIDPARQLQTLSLKGIQAPIGGDKFTLMERNLLLFDGISTAKDVVGDLQIERAITTYQLNSQGIDDPSYLDITTMATVAYLRYSERQRIALRFPRMKLADNGTAFGRGGGVVTPEIIRNELIALAVEWVAAGLIENIEDFIAEIIVERDANDPNRVNVLNPANIINQLRIYASKLEFRL